MQPPFSNVVISGTGISFVSNVDGYITWGPTGGVHFGPGAVITVNWWKARFLEGYWLRVSHTIPLMIPQDNDDTHFQVSVNGAVVEVTSNPIDYLIVGTNLSGDNNFFEADTDSGVYCINKIVFRTKPFNDFENFFMPKSQGDPNKVTKVVSLSGDLVELKHSKEFILDEKTKTKPKYDSDKLYSFNNGRMVEDPNGDYKMTVLMHVFVKQYTKSPLFYSMIQGYSTLSNNAPSWAIKLAELPWCVQRIIHQKV